VLLALDTGEHSMLIRNAIVHRTLLATFVVGGIVIADDSLASTSPTIQPKKLQNAPTVQPKLAPKADPKLAPKANPVQPKVDVTPKPKVDPKFQVDLSKIKPLTKSQIVAEVAAQGIDIKPDELRKTINLTPRQPWHNGRTYMSLMSGAWMPGQNPPSMSLAAGGPHGEGAFLELRIAAAKDTIYVVDCRVSATKRFFLKIRNLHHVIQPTGGHVVHAIPALPTNGNHTVFISSDGAWTSSGCSITPAKPID
jgi:hypothetical protein